jgi:hypothetical protein
MIQSVSHSVASLAATLVAAGAAGAPATAQSSLMEFRNSASTASTWSAAPARSAAIDGVPASPGWPAYTAVSEAVSRLARYCHRGFYCLVITKVLGGRIPRRQRHLTRLWTERNCSTAGTRALADRDNVSTALTVDLRGNVWVAGRKANSACSRSSRVRARATRPTQSRNGRHSSGPTSARANTPPAARC